jgi:Spy/CpxP family protein refolding chaperone
MTNKQSARTSINPKQTTKRIGLLALTTSFLVAACTLAQDASPHRPTVEQHVKLLSQKLGLNADQEAKAKPILREMTAAVERLEQDNNLSHQQQQDKIKASRDKADKKLRKILNPDQKAKLDQLEHQAPPGFKGEPDGHAPPR